MSSILQGMLAAVMGSKKLGLFPYQPNKSLDDMTKLFESGQVAPVIDRCYSLSETAEAFRYYASGNVKGKIVIKI